MTAGIALFALMIAVCVGSVILAEHERAQRDHMALEHIAARRRQAATVRARRPRRMWIR
jgi:hypothetical protein